MDAVKNTVPAIAEAVQTVYWVGFLLLLPRSVPVLMVTGVWLPGLLSMLILLKPMEQHPGVIGKEDTREIYD